jgi:hypothetical protein
MAKAMKSAAAYQYQYENISSMKSWRKRIES